mmetsp:Transcript_12123/g.16819  ORF Transcript_12123/g.16819 Transcript_12123/m.16819 type:complete len:165 (+) Transcript_12123:27-521(+)
MDDQKMDDQKDQFEVKHYDVRGCCDSCCCLTKDLTLLDDELHYKSWCYACNSGQEKVFPYGELSGMGEVKQCCCCPAINPGFSHENETPFTIGCCGDQKVTTEIVEELKKRARARGDIGQMKKTTELHRNMNELLAKVARVEASVAAIMKHLKIRSPMEEQKMQ